MNQAMFMPHQNDVLSKNSTFSAYFHNVIAQLSKKFLIW